MEYKFLNLIKSPEDVKNLSLENREILCDEIRDFLIDKVSKSAILHLNVMIWHT